METGESSESKCYDNDIWAKLVPLCSRYSDIELKSDETVVCSEVNSSSVEKQEWCKITRNKDQVSAILQNKSSNAIVVDEKVVEDDDTTTIRCGSEITLGSETEDSMVYRFRVIPPEKSHSKKLKILLDSENAKCSICLSVWHDVVTVAPCLHNFCNGCFSEWLRRREKHPSVLCPQCRATVLFVGRNHFLHGIEEDLLESDSSLRRPSEDIALLDSYASIKSPLVIDSGRKSRKRARSSQGDIISDPACPQCGNEYAGFQCNQSTVHLQCHSCGGMMPSRANSGVPQHCLGCDRAFCGAYWHSLGVTQSPDHPVCSGETLKAISQRSVTRIPFLAHEKNRHEQYITEKCISRAGKSLQHVVSEMVPKLNNREIDRAKLTLNHAEMITSQTHVCNECYDKLVSFLLYWFRITLPSCLLPPEALERENCWYGHACRTQHHSEEHARKRNHVCRPTRGSHMS